LKHNYAITQNKHKKLKSSLVVSYNVLPGNRAGPIIMATGRGGIHHNRIIYRNSHQPADIVIWAQFQRQQTSTSSYWICYI